MKPTEPTDPQFRSFKDLVAFATHHKFTVTSTTGGRHNTNSAHYKGLAIDVRTRDKTDEQVKDFAANCKVFRIWCYDERKRPKGQKVWSGPHLHLEIIRGKF